MKNFRVLLHLSKDEFDTLLRAISYYNYASSVLEYGEHVETCQNIHHQIMTNLRVHDHKEF